MRHLPVHWYEGMFLRPHHFQAAERFWSEQFETSGRWDNPYNYGLQAITISAEALKNHQLQITSCHARMRDGTLVATDLGRELDRLNLKDAFQRDAQVTVYLAIPKLTLGRRNVGPRGAEDAPRFGEVEAALQDQSAGGNDQAIQLLETNVRLLLSSQETAGYELLPIARIKRAGDVEAVPQVDDDYFPPVLAIDAWSPLGLDTVRAVYDIIGEKIDVLSRRVVDRGTTLASQEPGDLDDLLMLLTLNGAAGALRCLAFAGGVHPFTAYTELCRIVGQLSIFDDSRRAPEIPRYDHDDLARIFKWARQQIERLLGSRRQISFEQRFFMGTDRGLQVTIDPKWLHSGWQWYVGVNAENISERECRELLRPGNLDWKMGSAQQVDLIFKLGVPGVEQVELPQPPRGLPTKQGWCYYEIRRENLAWKDVLASQTLALRFKEQLISNLDKLPGQRKLEVFAQGKRAVLQFALFAVPPQTA